ncbi:hypothetical protein [Mesorhizobium sp. M0809]
MATLSNCLNQLATEGGPLRRSKTRYALTISCNLANANYWLLPRLKLFHREYPKLQVHASGGRRASCRPITQRSLQRF